MEFVHPKGISTATPNANSYLFLIPFFYECFHGCFSMGTTPKTVHRTDNKIKLANTQRHLIDYDMSKKQGMFT